MSNRNPKSLSPKRVVFLILAIAIAAVADKYFTKIDTDYLSKYQGLILNGHDVKVYALVPILYYGKLFLELAALVFIGYSSGTFLQLLASDAAFIVLGPVLTELMYAQMNKAWYHFNLEILKVNSVYTVCMLLITILAFLIRRAIKLKEKALETVLHSIIIIGGTIGFYFAFRAIVPFVFGQSSIDERTMKVMQLILKDTFMLFPATIGLIILFIIFSRLIFKKEFTLAQATAGTLNCTPTVPMTNAINNTINNTTSCNHCGSPLATGSKFCIKCGSVVEVDKPKQQLELTNEKRCTKCGLPLSLDAAFCVFCGTPTVNEVKAEPVFKEDQKQCPSCKKIIDKDSRFCPICGEVIIEEKKEEKAEATKALEDKLCTKCGKPLGKESLFCIFCGTPAIEEIERLCPSCSTPLDKEARFCGRCGSTVAEGVDEVPLVEEEKAAPVIEEKVEQEANQVIDEQIELKLETEVESEEKAAESVEHKTEGNIAENTEENIEESISQILNVEVEKGAEVVKEQLPEVKAEENADVNAETKVQETEQQVASVIRPKNKICSKCKQTIREDSKFCGTCGSPILEEKIEEVLEVKEKFCTNCGKTIEKNSKFCRYCGAKGF